MAQRPTKCPKCGQESLEVATGDTQGDEVHCASCGAVIGERSDFTSDMQKREDKFVKQEIADKFDQTLPGDDAKGSH
ncbi:hypothetical protein [Salinicola halophyticus]|uniref:hypothetical protein n=1 Tax=Salinicola halophyticus TaxID=1808881 RepID=UPI000DA2338D|nr:hypothetical protein [Salinicola halophyticus]